MKYSFNTEWKRWMDWMNNQDLAVQQICRRGAVNRLLENWSEGCGISSSDTNHMMFNLWKGECEKNFTKYLILCKELAKNADYEQGGL
jgi:hypothetical protein